MFSKELEQEIDKNLKMGEELKLKLNNMKSKDYHVQYENKRIWEKNKWLGIPCWKLPMDAFVIQELIVKLKPEYIIETGTGKGGSAMFYASICELIGEGKIITIDIEDRKDKDWGKFEWEDRIKFIIGNSLDNKIFHEVAETVGCESKCMVILDSWHSKEHVYREMLMYNRFVKKGGYMIVEDSHAAGYPVPWKYKDGGPMGAIIQWINSYGDKWEIDHECEKHQMTFNPWGYLRRK
jgi:cephalosporin hydroxylase